MDNIFVDSLENTHATVPMDAASLQHVKALRLREGERVRVLNGRGLIATARVTQAFPTTVLAVVEREMVSAPDVRLVVAMGMLDNRDRQEFAIEKVVELDASHIVLLGSDHASRQRLSGERLASKIHAAFTQCGRAWMPTVAVGTTVDDVVAACPSDGVILVGSQHASAHTAHLATCLDAAREIVVLTGPEGGFSEREERLLEQDQRVVSMRIGNHRLRAETASVALVAAANLLSGR